MGKLMGFLSEDLTTLKMYILLSDCEFTSLDVRTKAML